MPRNWRCANGHAWTGDLGALTYCPDCGIADVYEVRPEYHSGVSHPVRVADDAGRTIVQPVPSKPGTTADLEVPATIGDTLVQSFSATKPTPSVGDTLAQAPAAPATFGDTHVQPIQRGGDTFIQKADPGTTQEQAYLPADDAGTFVQMPALGHGPEADGGTLMQAPIHQDPSTLEMPVIAPGGTTLDQPIGPLADGPTLLAPKAASTSAETRVFTAPVGGGAASTPAETPTLDSSGPHGPLFRTMDYPSTVSVHRQAGSRQPDLSDQDTKPSPPSPSGRDGRTVAPPPVEGYEILGVLGRGGMGVVYKARQIKLNRIVALKMILAGGHAGEYEKQRFDTEMKAVADLQHPNIVQIYDSGVRDGLPYFSLEFCDGGSLQQKLGGQPMPPKIAADVAEQLSRAMQYAHERGIVHRDLKPANILFAGDEASASKDKGLASKDSKLTSKDAKAATKDSKVSRDASKDTGQSKTSQSKTGQSFTSSRASASTASLRATKVIPKVTDFGLAKRFEEESGLTGSGTILGTPSYMAPEQAAGESRSVGPPADIHALGAILYEMLTGRPPFIGDNVVETMNQVRTMDPVPPTRIQPKTPRDLETVCLKCLQKEMHKRYASAGDLADDLQRFLVGEPIAARPVSVIEKGWKWAKRRPSQAALIAMSLLMLVGVAAGGWTYAQIEKERGDREAAQTVIEARLKEKAQANYLFAREAVDNLLVRVGAEKLEQTPKAEKLRRELLEQSLTFYDRFLKEHGDDPSVQREAGWAYQRVGRIRNDLGDRKAAIAAYNQAVGLFEPLAHEATDKQTQDQLDLAQTRRQLAVVLEADNRPAEADKAYEDARKTLRELADAHSDRPEYRLQLGELLLDRGGQFYNRHRLNEAEDNMRQALAVYDELCVKYPTPENLLRRAKAQGNLGAVVLVTGRTSAAKTELDKAVDLLSSLAQSNPGNPENVAQLGATISNFGTAQWQSGDVEKAEATYREAIQRLTKLTDDFPKIPEYRFTLAKAYDNLAKLLLTKGERGGPRAAEPERKNARALYRQLVDEVPGDSEYRYRYALDRDEYAVLLATTDRLPQAIEESKAAVDMLRELVAGDPTNAEYVSQLAKLRLNLGQLYARMPQAAEAATEYAQAAASFEELSRSRLKDDRLWQDLPDAYVNQAFVFLNLGQGGAAERSMRRSVAVARRIVSAHADEPDAVAKSAKIQANLAVLPTIKPAESLSLLNEAVRWQRAALKLAPKRRDLAQDLGHYVLTLMIRLNDQGDHAAAAKDAADLVGDMPFDWPGWAGVVGQLGRCVHLARTDKNLSDEEKTKISAAYGDQALDLLQKAVAAGFKNAAALQESPDLEVLRNDPAFRPKFDAIIASIKK